MAVLIHIHSDKDKVVERFRIYLMRRCAIFRKSSQTTLKHNMSKLHFLMRSNCVDFKEDCAEK